MRYLIIIAFLFSSQLSAENGKHVPNFMLDWIVVCNMATADYQSAEDFKKLCVVDHRGAEFVADFWHSKAIAATIESRRELVEIYGRKTPESESQKKQNRLDLFNDLSLLLQGFYYDHAPQISAMIKMRITEFVEGRSPSAKSNADSAKLSTETPVKNSPPTPASDTQERLTELRKLRDEYFAQKLKEEAQEAQEAKGKGKDEPADLLPKN
jgi:hypothetical protein